MGLGARRLKGGAEDWGAGARDWGWGREPEDWGAGQGARESIRSVGQEGERSPQLLAQGVQREWEL